MTLSSSVHSQAFGFMSFLQNGVDPRTGQYTLSVSFPELKSNWLCGPAVPLALSFNPMNILDSGFGLGWNLNLSQFTPHNSILALCTGETFKVTGSGSEPAIREKKLDTFHFYNNQDGTYRVVHRSGLIEILTVGGSGDNRVALPTRLYAPTGHCIDLTYAVFRGGQRLQSISDAQGELVRINRSDSSVDILIKPGSGADGEPLAHYEMELNGKGWVTKIVLPGEEKPSWRFDYGNDLIRGILCLHKVNSPLGGVDTIDYQDDGHPFSDGVNLPKLPRVTRHRTDPGFGQPIMEVIFSYTSRNFLGAGITVSTEEGMDSLYNAPHGYSYGSTASLMAGGKVVRQVERTYSRFHAMTEEKTTQDHCVKREVTTYYAQDVPFDRQVAQFQSPKHLKTSWEMDNDPTQYREESSSTVFDENGNLREEIEASGIRTLHTYYPKEASDGCPADPQGFIRNRKDSTVIPAPVTHNGKLASTLRTRFRYRTQEPLRGSGLGQWLVNDSELVLELQGNDEIPLKHTLRTCIEAVDTPFLHGRPLTQSETLNGKTSTTSYAYNRFNSTLANEEVLEIVETFVGFDHVEGSHDSRKVIRQQQSLLYGLPVLKDDLNGNYTLTEYDALHRVIRETVAPDVAEYRATRNYRYTLTALDGQQASQEVEDAKGLITRTRLDGIGRSVYEEQQYAVDGTQATQFRQTFAAEYDALGNLVRQTSLDWLADQPLTLHSRFEYSPWGDQLRVIGPDGTASVSDLSPFGSDGPIERTWRESAGQPTQVNQLSESHFNRFGKLDRVTRFDAQPLNEHLQQAPGQGPVQQQVKALLARRALATVGSIEYAYNGYGNGLQQLERVDDMEFATGYEYDVWERMSRTTLPDDTLVSRTFAEHTSGDMPTSLSVKPANQELPEVHSGQQTFDGLLRQTSLTVGPRLERYEYAPGKMQVCRRITPSSKLIDYEYNLHLTDQPISIKTAEGEARFDYDHTTASLTNAANDQGFYQYAYTHHGDLHSETWTDSDNVEHETVQLSSLQGRPISRHHTSVLETVYAYDEFGRPESATQGSLRAEFEYDNLGQTRCITTHNLQSATTLKTVLSYDTLGREIERQMTLNGHPTRTISQVWQDDDQLKSRHLHIGARSLLKEEFAYDPRKRLIRHACSGEQLPRDAYGNPITSQTFRFDALDNIQLCLTIFANGRNDRAQFTYADDDSCQLKEVTHTYVEGGYKARQAFEYDADGHMLNDEQGQRLNYNSQGRLLSVKDADNEQTLSTYRYDGHNHLIGVREGLQEETLRNYEGYSLSHTRQGSVHTQYLFHGDLPLAEQQLHTHDRTLLLMTDASPSVIGECLQGTLHSIVYSAYGQRSAEEEVTTLLAFNGEVREAICGWYLLGRGYRVYNPALLRFHSPDSFSPFGTGGPNPYVYCQGNPIAFRDPNGHRAINNRRPIGPGYVDPIVEPKRPWWQKWLGVAGMVISLIVAVAFTPFTGGLSLGLVAGILGILLSVGALGLAIWATLDENEDMMSIAMWAGLAGSFVTIGAGLVTRVMAHLAAKAAAKAAASLAAGLKTAAGAGLVAVPAIAGTTYAIQSATASVRSAGAGSGVIGGSTRSIGVGSGSVGSSRSRASTGSGTSLNGPSLSDILDGNPHSAVNPIRSPSRTSSLSGSSDASGPIVEPVTPVRKNWTVKNQIGWYKGVLGRGKALNTADNRQQGWGPNYIDAFND